MSSDPASDQDASAESFVQRAELLADLGRYDEAVGELGFAISLDPAHVRALTVLARVQLAADRPAEALAAADAAIAVGEPTPAVPDAPTEAAGSRADPAPTGAAASLPDQVPPGLIPALVVRGLALSDLTRYAEAARTADRILTLGPSDGYAQRSGAALLGESRNGQPALNAAWRAVRLTPNEPDAHLVLSVVAARLGLYDLAERAYREALELDPELDRAGEDVGVVRLERRRYAQALEYLAATSVPQLAPGTPVPYIAAQLRRSLLYGAGYGIVAVVLVAVLAAGNQALSRLFAVPVAVVGLLLVWGLAARVTRPAGGSLAGLLRQDRTLALSAYAVAAAPCLILLYALVGTPWPLVLAIVATALAELSVLRRPVV